jgi:hypothetical protein
VVAIGSVLLFYCILHKGEDSDSKSEDNVVEVSGDLVDRPFLLSQPPLFPLTLSRRAKQQSFLTSYDKNYNKDALILYRNPHYFI